ncbi:MAG TPA: alpha/beta fold hydrolase [Gemmatimonadaceae bacterium]|jgi:hypothetical protein|nr:alpha/beta fold hydrolase [Gemmatimonadaceae bacterium]
MKTLIGIVVASIVLAGSASAQTAADRGAFVIHNGADTVVVDRFSRNANELRGVMAVRGQGRVEYVVTFGPENVVQKLQLSSFKPGATATDTAVAKVVATLKGDSVTFTTAGKPTTVATKAGAVPSLNNAIAITEIFTRRARATGRTGDYWYLAMSGGATLPLTIRPAGEDSLILTLAGQRQHYKIDAVGRILGGTIEGQPFVLSRATEQQAAGIAFGMPPAKPPAKPDYSAPAGANYTAEEVSFEGPGGITLGGTLTLPKNARGKVPAALTITGSGQEDRDEYVPSVGGVRLFRQVADTLSRVGIAVLRLDDRGLGASTGDFSKSTTADFADDIRAGLAYLRKRKEIDGDRLALIGHSEGGIIGPMVAATDPRLRALVTFGGPGDKMIEMSMAQNKWVVDHNTRLSPAQRDSILKDARRKLQPEVQTVPMLKWWMSYDPAPAARKVKAATLILQGENDRQVPAENAEKLAALIRSGGNKDVTVKIFPNTDHLMLEDPTGDFMDMYAHVKTNKVSPVILGTMADWLVAKLK